ncbi:ATPase, P-type (transporting), HAD superfamily, subfamily IC [Amycolatopsis sacchari]|uniref:ATPase, P-type (Transporting), HAD superfamily, subfamily IC n=2 Tax=Amycolatopsis sacchari TaxID=115433 RepID=A0A1I3X094_9PSEU|nr:ATPase, P-type (transporting), HAD superfamily, subfamily IC [Amycolatopsis sacchari]
MFLYRGGMLSEVRWAVVATGCFLAALAVDFAGGPAWPLYVACYAAGGWAPLLDGLRALREKTLDVDLLMIVAALGAAAIGQVFDGGLLIVIFAISGALEAVATRRTANSVRNLMVGEELAAGAELAVGDVVLVRPGERIAADGEVVDGVSEVDQASITGEPLPVPKGVGDEVFAGTLNGTGALRVRVTRTAEDTVVARIVAMVEEASATKAKTQLFIEKIEQRYSVCVVAATLALFFVPLAFGAALQPTLLRAMTFMIVASPCAVVLATMPPLLSAIANAGRHGVLVKSAVVMERLATVDRVAFDKTGTLTEGAPRVVEADDEVLRLAAAAEYGSEHPLGRAIVSAAQERGLEVSSAREFSAVPGVGVRAVVDGRRVFVGRGSGRGDGEVGRSGLGAGGGDGVAGPVGDGLDDGEVGHGPRGGDGEVGSIGRGPDGGEGEVGRGATASAVETSRSGPGPVVFVDGVEVGRIVLSDRLRDDAPAAVAALAEFEPVLLTGDSDEAARKIAADVGIADVRAELFPQDKVTAVRELGDRVLLVGDGINDAPALAAAHVGIAVGRVDLALQTADAVVVRDDLAAIPSVIRLARRARRLVLANLAIAATCIVGLVLWDLLGDLPLPLGVAGHEGSTALVALNGLRLLRKSAWG